MTHQPEHYARAAASSLLALGAIGAHQVDAVIAAFTLCLHVYRDRMSRLILDVPEPPADMPPRDAQAVAIEAYRKAIREGTA